MPMIARGPAATELAMPMSKGKPHSGRKKLSEHKDPAPNAIQISWREEGGGFVKNDARRARRRPQGRTKPGGFYK